ncbi:glycosyltransferase family 39 protein [Streptomyces sp. 5-6(2022)]|uniref:glycosyltransferase family 39 protein n=1 Tax=Streptomyces sp. 5-6(2022) TaxID=2936510 RepID=UPI0023B91E4B|nr:glycosyltransferase family 39 protein [Streptomyces sp. 5-6(2022)]
MAVMLGLGLWGLDRGTMWRDESATYQMARRTLPQIRDALGTVDAVHGLYYLLMHPVLALRPSEVTMRLPSVLAAVTATALVATLGCHLARPRVGLWAGLLYATTPVVTHYAQEGRSYALVAASATGATYLLVDAAGLAPGTSRGGRRADRPARGPALAPGGGAALAPGPAVGSAPTPTPGTGAASRPAGRAGEAAPGIRVRPAVRARGDVPRLEPGPPGGPEARGHAAGWRWAAYGGVVAVTALLHVFAVLMLAAHALTLLVSRAPRRVWWGWGSAAAGAVGAVAPLALAARRQSAQIAWMRHPTPGRLWAVVEDFAGPSALVLAVNLLLIAIAVIRPRRRSLTAVALPLICVPPVLLFALALHRPCFHERYLLFALTGIPLLAAAGADRLAGAAAGRLGRGETARPAAAGADPPVGVLADGAPGAGVDRPPRAVAGRLATAGADRYRLAGAVTGRLGWGKAARPSGVVGDRPVRAVADGLPRAVASRLARAVAGRRRAVVAAAGAFAVGCAFVWQFPLHQREREPLSRQDDLAALSAAVGRLTRPGEPVLYDPPKERRIAIAYPRPLAGLRDIALATPGPASGTLYGVDVGPTELLRRLDGTRSAWLIAADEPEARSPKAATLTGHFRLAYSLCLPGIRLEHYVRTGLAHGTEGPGAPPTEDLGGHAADRGQGPLRTSGVTPLTRGFEGGHR